jgi:hypothetical protein
MPLDLLVPDLLLAPDAPPAFRETRLPALEKWLARADAAAHPAANAHEWLASRFALPSPAPLAAIALAGEGQREPGSWLRADPAHLRIDHDFLKLHDASILDISRDEALALVGSLQQHFGADGLEWRMAAPDRWYVRAPEADLPATTSLERALGRDIFGLLPRDAPGGKLNWRSVLTEAQMVMSSHAVNARREQDGRPAVNSVWFWGEGATPAGAAKPYAIVHADDALARGLGTLSGAEVRARPATLADVDLPRAGESVLAVSGALTAALRRGDDAAWREAAHALDAAWFAQLPQALERFAAVRIVLPTGNGTRVYALGAASRWRIFRARKPLCALA